MGYHTEFKGKFNLNKPLDDETYNFLIKFNETRRMARNTDPKFGVEGEFFVDGFGFRGQDNDPTIIDHNRCPSTQPGLWCQWRPSEDRMHIEWDEGEKFYEYRAWLVYIIKNFLTPKGYTLSGFVSYQGEDSDDNGIIDGADPDPFNEQSGLIAANPSETLRLAREEILGVTDQSETKPQLPESPRPRKLVLPPEGGV